YYLNGGEAALNDLKKDLRLKEADLSAGKQAQLGGMMGLSFQKDARSNVAKILDEQASQPAVGGELSQAIYVKTLERVEETFSRPIPDSINESTRDDD
ncbi:unnamed protein product, partial [Ectocarpus sp. 12 AP-2014]